MSYASNREAVSLQDSCMRMPAPLGKQVDTTISPYPVFVKFSVGSFHGSVASHGSCLCSGNLLAGCFEPSRLLVLGDLSGLRSWSYNYHLGTGGDLLKWMIVPWSRPSLGIHLPGRWLA